jgi:GAF domain-containing protein
VTAEVLLYKRNRKQKGAPRQEPAAASSTAYVSDINREYARLLRFYVAAQRLLNTQSKEDLFNAIHEIIANLIGCEEIGIFRIDEGCKLSLVSSRGLDTEQFQRIPLGSSLIGKTLLSEDIYFGGEIAGNFRLPQEANLSACIPLRVNERLYGAIGIFRLLPQKPELGSDDKELLCLLARMTAAVLLCTTHCHVLQLKEEVE